LGTQFSKEVDVGTDVGAMGVAKIFDGVTEGSLSLFGETMITGNEVSPGTPSIKLCCHPYVGYSGAFVAQTCEFVVYF
jgi:hypothetical protein